MTDYVSVVTLAGKNRALKLLFGGSGNTIGYMGLSESTTDPTEASTAFPVDTGELSGGSYARQALTNTKPGDAQGVDKQVKSEATFGTGVVTATKNINQIGLFDQQAVGGTCFCICRIPQTVKDSTKSIKFTITNSVA